MRVLLLIDWHIYYTVEFANALANEHKVMLISRGHSFEVSSSSDSAAFDDFLDGCLRKDVIREKIKYRRKNILGSFCEIARLRKSIKNFKPDTLHIQETSDWRIYLIARIFGFSRTVLTVHDVFNHPGASRDICYCLVNSMRRNAKSIIVHGEFLKKQFISRHKKIKGNIYVIPHGVYDIYKKWDKGGIEEEKDSVLFFGRIEPYKGIDVLIKAAPLIVKCTPHIKIIIAGKGRLAVGGNSNFEIYNRFIPHEEVYKFFRRASIIVIPYIEASQSGVVSIAYAFGKPVVATNVGSIPEAVENGKTGLLVPPGDPIALSEAVVKLLKDDDLRKFISENISKKASTELSWENIANLTAEAYR